MANKRPKKNDTNGATLGFEEKLWLSADKLRGTVDAAEYKHVVLGLLFLKYISDAFEDRRSELRALTKVADSDYFTDGDEEWANQTPEDHDEYPHGLRQQRHKQMTFVHLEPCSPRE